MLKVDLGQLARDGSVAVAARIAASDDIWSDTELAWADVVEVRLRATEAGTGEIVARGTVSGMLRRECNRCLEPVDTSFREELTLVFVEEGREKQEDYGGAYVFAPLRSELDMSNAVREEVILAINPYVVCNPDCRGSCPSCGADLNQGQCDCTSDETDPRWAALRELKDE
jgi:uncharacterized protein